jgi:hypothetical protein
VRLSSVRQSNSFPRQKIFVDHMYGEDMIFSYYHLHFLTEEWKSKLVFSMIIPVRVNISQQVYCN